jgi:hypothetical protein
MVEFVKVIAEAHRMCDKYSDTLNNICEGCPACIKIGNCGEQDCALETLIRSAIFYNLSTDEAEVAAKKFERIVMDWSKKNA